MIDASAVVISFFGFFIVLSSQCPVAINQLMFFYACKNHLKLKDTEIKVCSLDRH